MIRLRLNKKTAFLLGGLLCLLVICTLVLNGKVLAFDNTFPDLNDTEGKAAVSAVDGETRYVRNTDGKFRVWFKAAGTYTITVKNGHFCNSNKADTIQSGDSSGWGMANQAVTSFHIYSGGGIDIKKYGNKYKSGNAKCNDNITFSVVANDENMNKENDFYFVNFAVNYVGPYDKSAAYSGIQNFYTANVSGANSRIGQRADSSGYGVTQEQTNEAPKNTDYFARFGTDCDINDDRSAKLTFYDLDNDGGSGAQAGGKIVVKLKDLSSSAANPYVSFDRSSGGSYIDGGAQKEWFGGKDNSPEWVEFTAKPKHKYRLEVKNVYYNNTLQFSLPFSQIFAEACPPENVEPTGTIAIACDPTTSKQRITYSFSDTDGTATNKTQADLYRTFPTPQSKVQTTLAGSGGNAGSNTYDFTEDDANAKKFELRVKDVGGSGTFNLSISSVNCRLAVSCVLDDISGPRVIAGSPVAVTIKGTVDGDPGGSVTNAYFAVTYDGATQNVLPGVRTQAVPPIYSQTVTHTVANVTAGNHTMTANFVALIKPNASTPATTRTIPCGTYSFSALVGPYFKAYGGDVQVGYGPTSGGSCKQADARIASWNAGSTQTFAGAGSQFGAQALGIIEGFASAQGSIGPAGAGGGLSFANGAERVNGDLYGGNFAPTTTATSCVDYRDGMTTTAVPTYSVPGVGDYVLGAGGVPSTVEVYVAGDVYIDKNIKYPASYAIGQIPAYKLVVLGDIYISANVDTLSGLFIAQPKNADGTGGGTIYTCATAIQQPVAGINLYSTCGSKQLKVYGSFVANKVKLQRAYGQLAESAADTRTNSKAAEHFVYSPELWIGQRGGQSLNRPDAIISLPPIL